MPQLVVWLWTWICRWSRRSRRRRNSMESRYLLDHNDQLDLSIVLNQFIRWSCCNWGWSALFSAGLRWVPYRQVQCMPQRRFLFYSAFPWYHICFLAYEILCPDDIGMIGTLTRWHLHPAQWLHRLPDKVSFEEGSLCEPLAVALAGIERSGLRLGDSLLIWQAHFSSFWRRNHDVIMRKT